MGALRAIFRFLLSVLGILFIFQLVVRVVRKIHPFPIPPAVGAVILDNPVRRRLVSAEEIVRRIGLEAGQQALEIGVGTGFVAFAAARAVGEEGRVLGLDVEPRMIERLRQRALVENTANLETKIADATKLDLPEDSFDCVYMVTVLGEVPDKRAVLWEAFRVLKPAGTLSVTEIITDPDYMLKGTVVNLAEESGFYLTEEHGNLIAYTVNFRKPSRRVVAS